MRVAHRIFFAVIGSIDDDWHSDYLREAQVTEKNHLAAGFSLMLLRTGRRGPPFP